MKSIVALCCTLTLVMLGCKKSVSENNNQNINQIKTNVLIKVEANHSVGAPLESPIVVVY